MAEFRVRNPATEERQRRFQKSSKGVAPSSRVSHSLFDEDVDLLSEESCGVLKLHGLSLPSKDSTLLVPQRDAAAELQRFQQLSRKRKEAALQIRLAEKAIASTADRLKRSILALTNARVEIVDVRDALRYGESSKPRTVVVGVDSQDSINSDEGIPKDCERLEIAGWQNFAVPGFSELEARIHSLEKQVQRESDSLPILRAFVSHVLSMLLEINAPSAQDFERAEELQWIEEESKRLKEIVPDFDRIFRSQKKLEIKWKLLENKRYGFKKLAPGTRPSAETATTSATTQREISNREKLLNLALDADIAVSLWIERGNFNEARKCLKESFMIKQRLGAADSLNEETFIQESQAIAIAELAYRAEEEHRRSNREKTEERRLRERELIAARVQEEVLSLRREAEVREKERIQRKQDSLKELKKHAEATTRERQAAMAKHRAPHEQPLKMRVTGMPGLIATLQKQGVTIPQDVKKFCRTAFTESRV